MNNPLDLNAVITSTRSILAQLLALDLDEVEADHRIVDDLSADSLDIVDLSFQLGRKYGCTLPKTSVLEHASELNGDLDGLVENKGLTASGVALLRNSLSAYSAEQLRVGMKPTEVFAQTTVRNWAQQCHNLFNYLPDTCPQCGSHHAAVNEREQVVCGDCSGRLTPLDGDDVSRQLVAGFMATQAGEPA
ncbi:acyl carrier protein [Atopomonas hussainii]|uniref:Acyl carrier protein n=1 Tax=Atopomonas hussainii TaxID=1429083 RepID=A0A1H7FJ41_9GAMM|nr:phosphopantetheine-binding protein [Atopomonas hussainii]SEK24462.1 acyl carrier protein [Atopomonas hussainii]